MDEGGTFTTAQVRTADRVNSGKFRTRLKTVSCRAKQKPNPVTRNYADARVLYELARLLIVLLSTPLWKRVEAFTIV